MYNLFIIIFYLLFIPHAFAGDLRFETTAEGITSALIKAKSDSAIKTRSLKGFGSANIRSIRVVEKEQGKIVHKTIAVPADKELQGVNLKIEFDLDSYQIRSDSYPLLNELGRALGNKNLMGTPLMIIGHTDSDGNADYNLKLSLQRAISTKEYLASNFEISPSLLMVAGYGEAIPLVPNDSMSNKQVNRRVEITIAP
jgi:OmpA-OmpF porin, OOP family